MEKRISGPMMGPRVKSVVFCIFISFRRKWQRQARRVLKAVRKYEWILLLPPRQLIKKPDNQMSISAHSLIRLVISV